MQAGSTASLGLKGECLELLNHLAEVTLTLALALALALTLTLTLTRAKVAANYPPMSTGATCRGPQPVAAHAPQGDSPFGVSDLVGNVW